MFPHAPIAGAAALPRALLVEGSFVARDMLMRVLNGSLNSPVEVLAVPTPREAPPQPGPLSLALVDIDLDPDGACELLSSMPPAVWRLATTLYDDEDRLLPALDAGIHGYLLKQDRYEQQVESLQRIVQGRPGLTPAMARSLLDHLRGHEEFSEALAAALTSISRGLSLREAARAQDATVPELEALVASVYRMRHGSTSSTGPASPPARARPTGDSTA